MKKQYSAADGFTVSNLLTGALDHLSASRALFKDEHPEHLDSAGYLAQLGVELLLKALLLHRHAAFPETHSLADLWGRVAAEFPEAKMRKEDSMYRDIILSLDRFYELRYPNPNGSPAISRGDWQAIELLVEKLWQVLPLELRKMVDISECREKFGRTVLNTQNLKT